VSDAEVALLIEAEIQSGNPIEAKAVARKKVSRLRGRGSGKGAKGTFSISICDAR
jgi:hypothetical protein